MKKTFVFVEDDNPAYRFPDAAGVISVTPMASYALERRGVSYAILEDYYSEIELRKEADAYFDHQLRWIDQWDELIRKHVHFCARENLSIARAHINRIKYIVDSLVGRIFAFRSFLEAEKPDEIVYLVRKHAFSERRSFYAVHDRSLCGYEEVIRYWVKSKRESFKFTSIYSDEQHDIPVPRIPSVTVKKIIAVLRRSFLIDGAKLSALFLGKLRTQNVFLFLDWGVAPVEEIVSELVRSGQRVFVKTPGRVREVSGFFRSHCSLQTPEIGIEREIRDAFARAFSEFLSGDLPNWIDQTCEGEGTSCLLMPFVRDFFENLGPTTCLEVSRMMDWMRHERISCIVARASSGENYPAPLLAGTRLGVLRFCLQHSCGASDEKDWVFDELDPFTDLLAMCPYMKEYFEKSQHRYGLSARRVADFSQSLRLLAASTVRQDQRKRKTTVLYAPRKLAGWGVPHLNSVAYPITWFYRLQQAFIDYFGGFADADFIYKHTHQRWSDESALRYLTDKKYGNVRAESGPLTAYLPRADRVLFDYPSTGFFEAMVLEKPVLCLYHESVRIAPRALECFGKSLRRFATVHQAVDLVDRFLKADPKDFCSKLSLGGPQSFSEILFGKTVK